MPNFEGAHPNIGHLGKVPIAEAAKVEHIGKPTNVGATFGDQWVFISDGGVRVDGMHLKNVMFSNVEINYAGGPLILENVYFVNCTFRMPIMPHSQGLATTFLASNNSVTANLSL